MSINGDEYRMVAMERDETQMLALNLGEADRASAFPPCFSSVCFRTETSLIQLKNEVRT